MKKLLFIFTLLIAVGLSSCSKDIEETEEVNAKLGIGTGPGGGFHSVTCKRIIAHDAVFGTQCIGGGTGCSAATICSANRNGVFMALPDSILVLILSKFPEITKQNWHQHKSISGDYDVQLALWEWDSTTFIHPNTLGLTP